LSPLPNIPIRTCIGCRSKKPKSELMRIVVNGPERVVIDLNQREPGRAAYLCPEISCLRKSGKKRLEKASRCSVSDVAYTKFAEQFSYMTGQSKIIALIGLAHKAGKVSIGRTQVEHDILSHRAKLILCSTDISPTRLQKLQQAAQGKIPVEQISLSRQFLGQRLGRKEVAIIAIRDQQFSQSIIDLLKTSQGD
jgi:predicted RNA-binding protein YlxR (DUF448 family)/ribosomal protein L30E